MLGDAFLSGHTYLKLPPSPQLLALPDPYDPNVNKPYILWDASLYKGKYYLYFGPVPAVLWAITKFTTGFSLSDPQIVLLFCCVATACLSWLLLRVALRESSASYAGLTFAVLSLGLGTWLPFMLRRPSFYEVAVSGSYCFSALGFLLLWQGFVCRKQATVYWLTIASLCFGLSVGCRVPHVFNGVVLMIAWLAIGFRQKKLSPFTSFFCLFVPWSLCVAGLAWYNYVRFDSLFETGVHYQLTFYNSHHMNFSMMQWDKLISNSFYYLIRPLPWSKPFVFPFFHVTYYDKFVLPGNIVFESMEPLYGLFSNSPFSLWLFTAPYLWKKCPPLKDETRALLSGIVLYGATQLGLLLFFFYNTVRYEVDFAPWIMFFASIQYLRLLRMAKTRWGMWLLLIFGIITTFYGVFAGTMSGYCGQYLCAKS
jgi:hypothetical protein